MSPACWQVGLRTSPYTDRSRSFRNPSQFSYTTIGRNGNNRIWSRSWGRVFQWRSQ